MDPARTLCEGVAGWLLYEFQCGRSELFSEKYMAQPIAQILFGLYGKKVHAEFNHPVLTPLKKGRGRPPQIDFAVIDSWPKPICVLESKWIDKDRYYAKDVVWDLLRLEMVAHQASCDAYFLLAGKRKHIDAFFESSEFKGELTPKGTYRRLLKLDERRNARLRLDSPPPDRVEMMKKLLKPYPGLRFPSRITTSVPYRYPKEDLTSYQYQSYCWKVMHKSADARFSPGDHPLYR